MLLTKLKNTVILLLLAVAVFTSGLRYMQATEPAVAVTGSTRPAVGKLAGNQEQREAKGETALAMDLDKLQGKWIAAGGEYRGAVTDEEATRQAAHRFVIKGKNFEWFTALSDKPFMKGTFEIDPGKKPKELDLTVERDGKTVKGKCIYDLGKDTWMFNYGEMARPTEFKTTPDNADLRLYLWKREP
jgi:uncharacterized protein (TIGR03067 family)